MATPSPKGFAELLQSAVHEPGILSQAYQQFHSYSLGMFQCHQPELLKAGMSRGGR